MYDDVVVGAFDYDNGQTDEGRAFLYLGSPFGLEMEPAWTAESDKAAAHFSVSVASAGDVNADGYDDVVVGAYSYTHGQLNEGRAYLYFGSPQGLEKLPAWIAESNQEFASFGHSVSSAGDVNGDGYDDVLVGAYGYSAPESEEGRAYLYLGSPTGLTGDAAWIADSDQAYAYFGVSVASAGDVNADGYDDALVGADFYSHGETNEGRAYLYLGLPQGLGAAPAWIAESNQASALFGRSVASAGDVNADGCDDALVGAPDFDHGLLDVGRAYLYLGSPRGLRTHPLRIAESNQVNAELGYSVASSGDTNADGYDDVLVGAHYYDHGQTDEGAAFGLYGRPGGT